MFATRQSILTRYGADEVLQLTNRSGVVVPVEALETAVEGGDISGYSSEIQAAIQACLDELDEALEDALGDIEPRLQAGGYTLPLAQVPRKLVTVHRDIARYYLHGDALTDVVLQRYKDAISWLRAVVSGQADLGLTAADETADAPDGGVQTDERTKVFDDDTLDRFASFG